MKCDELNYQDSSKAYLTVLILNPLRRPGPPTGRAQGRNRVLGSRGQARQHAPRGRAASSARERPVEPGRSGEQRAGDDEAGDGDGAQRGRGPV